MDVDSRLLWGTAAIVLVVVVAVLAWPKQEPAASEQISERPPPGPCDRRPRDVAAELLEGPFETFEALCEAWGGGACERLAQPPADNFLPFDDLVFLRRQVSPERADDDPPIALAIESGGRFFLRSDAGRRYEDLLSQAVEGRRRDDGEAMLFVDATFERTFHHQPDDPEGPVQHITRRTWLACSRGPSGRPSCFEVPVAFHRETRRPGKAPEDTADSALSPSFCDNGLLLFEGTLERLSRDNEERVEALLGLNRITYP